MRAEELRIGNWIHLLSKGKDYQIGSGHDIEEIESSNDASLIPLTEEWLLKFGFKKYNEYWDLNEVLHDMGGIGGISSDMTIYQSPDVQNYYSCYLGNYDTRLKYVHQLQNLYYALTNKEL